MSKKRVDEIVKRIKEVKIQGATEIAKEGLYAYSLSSTKKTKEKLIKARPTEPLLFNVLKNFDKLGKEKILERFDYVQERINNLILKILKNKNIIFTHCHSNTLVKALIYSKKKGRSFEVYNTETRPLFQGRKTARELRKAGIKVTTFVDSAARIALLGKQGLKKAEAFMIGADAITKAGAVNKIGSGMFAEISYAHGIPVYIVADSWKFSENVELEKRNPKEVWDTKLKIRIINPAFELIPRKYIKAVISEKGILSFEKFLKNQSN